MIYTRFIDFEFPFYKQNQEKLIDITKNYYKIYPTVDKIDFVEQTQFPLTDKSKLKEFYNKLIYEYECSVFWQDGNENILYCKSLKTSEVVNLIYEFRDFIYPKKYGIENGFYTEESLKQEILDKLPIIEICFYE